MKGIAFSQQMMVAWLKGRKSITRRLINPQPSENNRNADGSINMPDGWVRWKPKSKGPTLVWNPKGPTPYDMAELARYLPGETVYIKETWAFHDPLFDDDKADAFRIAVTVDPSRIIYRATSPDYLQRRWRSPRFMPEWASRSHALIVSVRPEQLKEFTHNEAVLEGFPSIAQMISLWIDLYRVWDPITWVWRIELERKP